MSVKTQALLEDVWHRDPIDKEPHSNLEDSRRPVKPIEAKIVGIFLESHQSQKYVVSSHKEKLIASRRF